MSQLEIKEIDHEAKEMKEFLRNSEAESADTEGRQEINSCESKIWVVGTVIFITGSLLTFAAFAFAPQSILACIEGIQFVTNVLFGKFILGSIITYHMYAGTAIVIVGLILTVVSASVVEPLTAGIDELRAFWANPYWIVYLCFCVVFGVVLHFVHVKYEQSVDNKKNLPYSHYVLPMTFATFSALFGTMSVVFAKILAQLLKLQFEGLANIFTGGECWFFYVTLVAWFAFVGVWLFRMNQALSLYDPLFIIPLLQVNFIMFAVVSGGVYFGEFEQFGPLSVAGFVVGIALLFFGIYLLSPEVPIDDAQLEGSLVSFQSISARPVDAKDIVEMMPARAKGRSSVGFGSDYSIEVPVRDSLSTRVSMGGRDSVVGRASSFQEPLTRRSVSELNMSLTRRSIAAPDQRGPQRPSARKTATTFLFKFGAVASLHDATYDRKVDHAILNTENAEDAWKKHRIQNRRRMSNMPSTALSPSMADDACASPASADTLQSVSEASESDVEPRGTEQRSEDWVERRLSRISTAPASSDQRLSTSCTRVSEFAFNFETRERLQSGFRGINPMPAQKGSAPAFPPAVFVAPPTHVARHFGSQLSKADPTSREAQNTNKATSTDGTHL
jgi:hypothetical protein